jgi:phospholipase C
MVQPLSVTPTPVTSLSITAGPTVVNSPVAAMVTPAGKIKTVFIIMMENHNWSDIQNNPSAPYINQTLLPQASYALEYYNPPGNHPSEPNYLWLEAGTSFGVQNDDSPRSNHQSAKDHLVTYLDQAGFSWKAYQEGISDNVTNSNDPNSAYCIAHERPYSELQADLKSNAQAQYNFITPNLCNDMHNSDGCPSTDEVKNGDTWLSEQIPMIMGSQAYQQGGVIFIIWDESENGDHPIGMIVLSPFAKGGGYSNSIHYTHSSTLRTVEEIFNLTPLLGDASNATDLSDLFSQFP